MNCNIPPTPYYPIDATGKRLCLRVPSVFPSSVSRKSVLWELDRETFKAICYEAAQKARKER